MALAITSWGLKIEFLVAYVRGNGPDPDAKDFAIEIIAPLLRVQDPRTAQARIFRDIRNALYRRGHPVIHPRGGIMTKPEDESSLDDDQYNPQDPGVFWPPSFIVPDGDHAGWEICESTTAAQADPDLRTHPRLSKYRWLGCELRAPIQWATPTCYFMIEEALNTMTREFRLRTPPGCGLHVQVGVGQDLMELEHLRKLALVLFASDTLLSHLHPPERILSSLCPSIRHRSPLAKGVPPEDYPKRHLAQAQWDDYRSVAYPKTESVASLHAGFDLQNLWMPKQTFEQLLKTRLPELNERTYPRLPVARAAEWSMWHDDTLPVGQLNGTEFVLGNHVPLPPQQPPRPPPKRTQWSDTLPPPPLPEEPPADPEAPARPPSPYCPPYPMFFPGRRLSHHIEPLPAVRRNVFRDRPALSRKRHYGLAGSGQAAQAHAREAVTTRLDAAAAKLWACGHMGQLAWLMGADCALMNYSFRAYSVDHVAWRRGVAPSLGPRGAVEFREAQACFHGRFVAALACVYVRLFEWSRDVDMPRLQEVLTKLQLALGDGLPLEGWAWKQNRSCNAHGGYDILDFLNDIEVEFWAIQAIEVRLQQGRAAWFGVELYHHYDPSEVYDDMWD